MSTSATAITLTLGAVLGAGWVKTFSDGAASMNVLSAAGENIDETLTRIGARKTPLFDNLADSEEKLERARRELERYQAKLNDKTPTESQTREAARLTAAVDAAQRARDKDKRKLDEIRLFSRSRAGLLEAVDGRGALREIRPYRRGNRLHRIHDSSHAAVPPFKSDKLVVVLSSNLLAKYAISGVFRRFFGNSKIHEKAREVSI